MSDLTAIDILIDPDEHTVKRAREVNARMLESVPTGWALDDSHQPHITTLQRYVRTADLDQAFAAVERVVAETEVDALSYQVTGIRHQDWGFPGIAPTAAAFVRDPGEEISRTIINWVEAFVPNQIGESNYLPHLTVGVATFDDLKVIEAEPFGAFPVHPVSVAVYHLGNNGTARELLKAWSVAAN
jgi:hypothetical protein